jgi:hypothetical protein
LPSEKRAIRREGDVGLRLGLVVVGGCRERVREPVPLNPACLTPAEPRPSRPAQEKPPGTGGHRAAQSRSFHHLSPEGHPETPTPYHAPPRNQAPPHRVVPPDAGVSTTPHPFMRGATLGPRSEPTGAFLSSRNAAARNRSRQAATGTKLPTPALPTRCAASQFPNPAST